MHISWAHLQPVPTPPTLFRPLLHLHDLSRLFKLGKFFWKMLLIDKNFLKVRILTAFKQELHPICVGQLIQPVFLLLKHISSGVKYFSSNTRFGDCRSWAGQTTEVWTYNFRKHIDLKSALFSHLPTRNTTKCPFITRIDRRNEILIHILFSVGTRLENV